MSYPVHTPLMDPNRANTYGLLADDVQIIARPQSADWLAVAHGRTVTSGSLFAMCRWRANLARLNRNPA